MGNLFKDSWEHDVLSNIEKIKIRWNEAKKNLEDVKYLENLIHLDYIHSIKYYKTAWDYRIPTIKSAVDELNITDKRKKRPSLSCLNSWIKEEFFPEVDVEIKVNKITSYGYEGYHWQMDFEIDGETYAISVPNKDMLTMENLEHAMEGKFGFLHRTSKSSISVEYTNYDIEKVANYIKVYFTDMDGNTTINKYKEKSE